MHHDVCPFHSGLTSKDSAVMKETSLRASWSWMMNPRSGAFCAPPCSSHQYEVIEAETGALALAAIVERHPDLIILDLGLPDIDGVEVTRQVREWSQVPIIILSVRDREPDKIERPGCRRRRLPDQALWRGRAAGAHPGGDAARRCASTGAGLPGGGSVRGSGPPPGDGLGRGGLPDPHRVRAAARAGARMPARWSPTAS